MTRRTTLPTLPRALEDMMSAMNRGMVGFDSLVEQTGFNPPSYPSYDIIRRGENAYTVAVALAGHSKDEITVSIDSNILTIEANKVADESTEYLYRGIAKRKASLTLPLAEFIIVEDAEFVDGMLKINLVKELPEELKARVIEIK